MQLRKKIEPTVMDQVTWSDKVMSEEIFGPLMPILTFDNIEGVIHTVNSHDKPLALYIYAENKKVIRNVLSRCTFGSGCVNDCIIHLATSGMGFGGVGESGMGAYHGKSGFDTFTHYKSIVDKKTWLDIPMRYQPYTKLSDWLIHIFCDKQNGRTKAIPGSPSVSNRKILGTHGSPKDHFEKAPAPYDGRKCFSLSKNPCSMYSMQVLLQYMIQVRYV